VISFLPVYRRDDVSGAGCDAHDQDANQRLDLVHGGLCVGECGTTDHAGNEGTENQDEEHEGSHGLIVSRGSFLGYENSVVIESVRSHVNARESARHTFTRGA
jgi:hypothetical protein